MKKFRLAKGAKFVNLANFHAKRACKLTKIQLARVEKKCFVV